MSLRSSVLRFIHASFFLQLHVICFASMRTIIDGQWLALVRNAGIFHVDTPQRATSVWSACLLRPLCRYSDLQTNPLCTCGHSTCATLCTRYRDIESCDYKSWFDDCTSIPTIRLKHYSCHVDPRYIPSTWMQSASAGEEFVLRPTCLGPPCSVRRYAATSMCQSTGKIPSS